MSFRRKMTKDSARYRSVTTTVEDYEKTQSSGNWNDFKCSIEPIPNAIRETILVRLPSAARLICWLPPVNLKPGDEVEFDGKVFELLPGITEDIFRPRRKYYKGFLAETFHEEYDDE